MQLPKYKKKKQTKLKICLAPDCGKEFWGHPISKYCEIHRDYKHRPRKRKPVKDPDEENQLFTHNFVDVTVVEFECALSGCSEKFSVPIYPKQALYPKFCEEHRSPFKRQNFARMIKTAERDKEANKLGEN